MFTNTKYFYGPQRNQERPVSTPGTSWTAVAPDMTINSALRSPTIVITATQQWVEKLLPVSWGLMGSQFGTSLYHHVKVRGPYVSSVTACSCILTVSGIKHNSLYFLWLWCGFILSFIALFYSAQYITLAIWRTLLLQLSYCQVIEPLCLVVLVPWAFYL